MAIDPLDERLLAIAETMPVDGTDIADSADDEQERHDADASGDIDPKAAIRDSVRLDVLRILARECTNELSVVRYKELLAHPRVSEQFAAIEDETEREECIVDVFKDIAEEALDASIVFDERYGEVNPVSTEYTGLIFRYSRLMLARHGFGPAPDQAPRKLSAEEEEKLLRDAETTAVDMDVVIKEFNELSVGEFDEPDMFTDDEPEIIESVESSHHEQISRMLSILSGLCAGAMSIRTLMRIRTHPELREQLVTIDKDARDECFHNVFFTIAEHALKIHPLIKGGSPRDAHGAEMNVANYAIRLMERHGIA